MMSSITSHAFYDILPPELTYLVFDHLLPHQLIGLALSCRRALVLTDLHFSKRISSLERIGQGAALRWASGFRKLPSDVQSAIETTIGLLPLLDVSVPLDDETRGLYLEVASARCYAQEGLVTATMSCTKRADQTASKTGLKTDFSALMRQCRGEQFDLMMELGKSCAQNGVDEATSKYLVKATEAAIGAGRPPPDFSRIMQECWEKKLDLTTKRATESAQQGLAERTSHNIETATEAAIRAGPPPPDFSKIMQECREKKLDLTTRQARECALHQQQKTNGSM